MIELNTANTPAIQAAREFASSPTGIHRDVGNTYPRTAFARSPQVSMQLPDDGVFGNLDQRHINLRLSPRETMPNASYTPVEPGSNNAAAVPLWLFGALPLATGIAGAVLDTENRWRGLKRGFGGGVAAELLAGCVTPSETPAPIVTESPISTVTMTSTPTPGVQETSTEISPEQKATAAAEAAVARGEKANEWQKWTDSYYKGLLENAPDPTKVSDEQLKELDTYMTAMRKADYLKFLAENPQEAAKIVEDFTQAFLPGADLRDIEKLVSDLTPEQRMYLEIVYRATKGESILRSPVEKIRSMEDGLFSKYTEKKDGTKLVSVYGIFDQATDHIFEKDSFPVRMYGRDTFEGKPIMSSGGFSPSAYILADYVGVEVSPQGTSVLLLTKDDKIHLADVEVITTEDNPILFGKDAQYSVGPWSEHYTETVRPPTLTFNKTIYGNAGFDNFSKDFSLLTRQVLLDHLAWSPEYVGIHVPSITDNNLSYIQTFFPDPETGSIVLGTAQEELGKEGQTGIFFYQNDLENGFRNPWP